MATSTTLVVSLFLLNTASFESASERASEPPSPLPEVDIEEATPIATQVPTAVPTRTASPAELTPGLDGLPLRAAAQGPIRTTSLVALPSQGTSSLGLFGAPATTLTPKLELDDPFNSTPFASETFRGNRLSLQTGVSSRLLHSDADVPAWGGNDDVYNQPRSRAGPMTSRSVVDFGKLHPEFDGPNDIQAGGGRPLSEIDIEPVRETSAERDYGHWSIEPAVRGNGGLVNAVRSAIETEGLDVTWVGTLGFPTDSLREDTKLQIEDRMMNEHESEVVFVSDVDFKSHYEDYCKSVLWPVFHYRAADHIKSKAFQDNSWKYYENVNRAFADKVKQSYKEGDTIWVHDYHLLLVPAMVREKLPSANIGFFLHTAFPSSEIFRSQADYRKLLNGMLGANLVAFQLKEYAEHFLQTCSRFMNIETTEHGVQLEDRFVNVTWQPIGINPSVIQEIRQSDEFKSCVQEVRERYKGKKLIVARDKLDHVHGVRQKLLTYEQFLRDNPHRRSKTVLLQIITSTHEHEELLPGIYEIMSRVERKYGSITHQPLVVMKQDLSQPQYYALLTAADVLMVATQRDGMNLIAHEFIYCQDSKSDHGGPGALILSEFAGSASVLKSQRLLINPWDQREHVRAILTALEMTEDERIEHWAAPYATVVKRTGGRWFTKLSDRLAKACKEQKERSNISVRRLSTPKISAAYEKANSRLFVLDYEGTLLPGGKASGLLLTPPHGVVDIVNDLMMDPKNVVYVMSGITYQDLAKAFQTANGVGLIAENGCFLRKFKTDKPNIWESVMDQAKATEWKEDFKKSIQYYQERIIGSIVEELDCSLIFRYDDARDPDIAPRLAGECADQINSSGKTSRIRAVPISNALLIEHMDYDKSTMAKRALGMMENAPDFLMIAGDDREDEVVFRWGNELGKEGTVGDVFTVSIGRRNTEAQASLSQGSTGLLGLLQRMAQGGILTLPVRNPGKKLSKPNFTLM